MRFRRTASAVIDGADGIWSGGQTVIINGASAQLGSAAILFALARGAGRIFAVGRDEGKLAALARLSPRIAISVSSGEQSRDTRDLLNLCEGGADLAVDYLANTPTPATTLAAINALKLGGTRHSRRWGPP